MKLKKSKPLLTKLFGITAVLVAALTIASAKGGTATLAWDLYSQGPPNPNTLFVDKIQVFAVPGTNTTWTANNANATFTNTVSVTTTSTVFTNLTAGEWTFAAVALVSTNNFTSPNSTNALTFIPLGSVLNFRVQSSGP